VPSVASAEEGSPRAIRIDVPLVIKPISIEASSARLPDEKKGEDFYAKNAADGSPNSRWESIQVEPQWLALDLGNTYYVDKIIVLWGTNYAVSYKISISKDKINWKEVRATENGRGGTETVTFPLSEIRHIRIDCITQGEEGGFSVREISVLGKRRLVLL